MARKPTIAEQRRALLFRPFSDDELQDPSVLAIKKQREKEEEERKAAALKPKETPAPVASAPEPTRAPSYMERANANLGQEIGNAVDIVKNTGNLIGSTFQSSGAEQAAVDARQLPNMTAEETAALRAQANQLAQAATSAREGQDLALAQKASELFARADQADQLRNDPLAAKANLTEALGYRKLIQDKAASATRSLDRLDFTGVAKTAAPILGNVRGLLPIAGGIVGAVAGEAAFPTGGGIAGAEAGSAALSGPMIHDIYNQNFNKAMDQGMNPAQADSYASKVAGVQGAVQVLGGGILAKVGAGESSRVVIDNLIKHVALKGTKSAAVGAGFGAATIGAENATNKYIANTSEDAATRRVANESLPADAVDLWTQLKPALGGGAILGGGLGGVHSTFEAVREAGRDTARIQKVREQYADKPKYTDAITPDLPGIPSATDYAGPVSGRAPDSAPAGPTKQDVQHLRFLNDNIQVLEDKISKGKAKSEDTGRLLLLKGARARLIGADKPRVVGNKVVEPGLGLDYPTQPLNPQFTGMPEAEPTVSGAEPIPAAVARAATPTGGSGKNLPRGNAPKPGTTPRAKKGTPTTPGLTSADQIAALRANKGNAQLSGEGTTDTTVEDVVNHITKGQAATRSGDQKVMTKLLHDRNIEIVPDESHIPAGAEKTGASGFYDGKRSYIVANRLNKGNLMGDLLNVAAHEIHHAADRSGAVTLSGFVGKDQTEATIKRLEAAAAKGDPIAKTAVDAANAANEANPGAYAEEVIPYAINAARKMQERSSVGKRIVQDFASAVRTKAKKFVGNADVNLNDIAYLSDKLLQEAAIQGKPMTSDGPGRAIILSGGKGEAPALQRNRTWLSADGKRKFEVSDHNSRVTLPDDYLVRSDLKLPDVLHHPELYDLRPELKDVSVVFGNLPGGAEGSYFRDDKTIVMNPSTVKDGSNEFNSEFHQNLIHEAQHAAQDASGTTGGSNPMKMLSPEGKELSRQLEDAYANLNYVEDHANIGAKEETVKFLRQEIVKLQKKFDPYYQEAYNKYVQVLGEQEANFSMDNIPLTQGEREDWGPNDKQTPEALSLAAHGEILSPNGKRLAKDESPRPAGLASNLEGLTARLKDNVESSDKITKDYVHKLAKLFTPTGGRGDDINRILAKAAGTQADLGGRIENASVRVKDAISNAVKKGLGTEPDVIKALTEATEKADKEADSNTRKSIIAALDRNYPGLGTAMNQLRDFKLNFTETLFNQRILDPKPLSEKELNIYRKMHEQAEKYNTRAYLATFGGKVSYEYARGIMRAFHDDPTSEQGSKVQTAIDFLVDKQLSIPDREVLENYNTADLKRMYETWMGKTVKMSGQRGRDKMIEELTNLPPKTAEELKAKAIETVKDLLGLNEQENALAKYYRGSKQDRTILEARKNVPPEIRSLMGEITHPLVKEIMSLVKMSALIHKTQSLIDIHDNLEGKEWSHTVSEEFPIHLSSEAYGPMDGKFASKRLADVMKDSRVYSNSIDDELKGAMNDPSIISGKILGSVLKPARALSTAQKVTSLVATPMALMYNITGSWLMAVQNGVVDPVLWSRSFKDTAETLYGGVTHRQNDKGLDMSSELRQAKVLDSATIGSLRGAANKDMFDMIRRLDPNDKTFKTKVRKIMHNSLVQRGFTGAKLAREMYALMDVWTKVAAYRDKKAYLSEFYKAEGIKKSESDLINEAGYEVAQTNISYDMAIPIFRLLERNFSPIFMFATYTSECYRANAMSYVQVFRDLARAQKASSPEGRRMAQKAAMKRLTGTLAATVGLNAVFMHLLNGRSDEEKRQDKLDAPWEKNDVKIPLGTDKDGNKHYLGMSRFDPIGPNNELFRTAMMAKTPEEQHDAMKTAVTQFFINSRSNFALAHVLGDIIAHSGGPASWEQRDKKNTFLEKNYPKTYQKLVNTLQAGDMGANLAELTDTLMPGVLRPLLDPHVNDVVKVQKGDFPALGSAMSVLGGKSYVLDPNKSMTFKVIDYTKGVTALKTEQKQFLDRQKDLNPDEIVSKLRDLREKEKTLQANLADAYDGYQAFGKPKDEALKVLHDAQLTTTGRKNLLNGTSQSELMNTKNLSAWYKKSIKMASTPEEKESIRNKYKLLKTIYIQENTN